MIECPNCQRNNPEGMVICIYCGAVLNPEVLSQQTQTRNFGENDRGENEPRWGTARFNEGTRLILRVSQSGQIIHPEVTQEKAIVLGRYDPSTGQQPDVDLSAFEADQLGVSRNHARLSVHEGSLYITDLGAANATYLNGLRLTAHRPRILRDGDEIRLARLKLQVSFVDVED